MNIISIITAALAIVCSPLIASPMRGPIPKEQREFIQFLASHHSEITREVKLTESGYTATTTSTNPEVVATLQSHIAYMKKRVESGAMVRRWDPAYEEMSDHFDKLTTDVTKLDNGVQVTVTGKTKMAVKVAHNHARIVSAFVKNGQDEVQSKHPVVEADKD